MAIAACDPAEVIGSAIALNLLFGLPLIWGVCLTALDVLAILYLQHRGFRVLEAIVVVLIATIGSCYLLEIIFVKPDFGAIARGFVPTTQLFTNQEMLYIAISMLGATVMPLIFSQVILSLQLSFAVIPLVLFTSDRSKMGEFVNPGWVKGLAWIVTGIIAGLNAYLLIQTFAGWVA